MSYYFLNRQELLQKAKNKYHNFDGIKKAAEYYIKNKNVLREKAKNKYINLSEEGKEGERKYGRNRYKNMKENAK